MYSIQIIVFCGLVFCVASAPTNLPNPPQGNTCSCLLGQLLLTLSDLVKNQKSACFSPLVDAAVQNLQKDGILATVAPPAALGQQLAAGPAIRNADNPTTTPEPPTTTPLGPGFELGGGPGVGVPLSTMTSTEPSPTSSTAADLQLGGEPQTSTITPTDAPTSEPSTTPNVLLGQSDLSSISVTLSTVPTVSAPPDSDEQTTTPIYLSGNDPKQSQGIGSDYLRLGGQTTTLEPSALASVHNPPESQEDKCSCPNHDHQLLYVPLLRFEGKPDKKSFQFYLDCLFGDKQ